VGFWVASYYEKLAQVCLEEALFMQVVSHIKLYTVMVALILLVGCSSLGPKTLASDLPTWDELENVDATLSVAAITTYYVSGTGSDSNTGKSTATAFRTLQKAANLTNPGDTVYIMNGTYTDSVGSHILLITRSGAPGAYIRYKAFPGHRPVLQTLTTNWSAVKVDGAAYILIEGLTLFGNNDTTTPEEALAQIVDTNGSGKPDKGDKVVFNTAYISNGIDVTFKFDNFARPAHHVIVRGNTLSKFGGSGIGSYGADFLIIEDNRVDETSFYTPYDTSGISVYQNRDTQPGYAGYRIVIRRNVSTHNHNIIPCICNDFARPTDGNGIIVDDSKNGQSDGRPPENGIPQDFGPYTGKILVANNIVYDNWGRGIHVFESDNVNIINNTSFNNAFEPEIGEGEISVVNSDNVRVYNNIMYPNGYRASVNNKSNRAGIAKNRNVVIDYNLAFGGTGFFDSNISDPVATRNNLIGVDPKFVGATYTNGRDFRLQANSPAIDKGTSSYAPGNDIEKFLRPQGAGIDIGAYELR
jgi:parallel beta-helix repeat protein